MTSSTRVPDVVSCEFYEWCILGDPGGDSGAEDENQNGREKFDEQKYERKIGAPGDKLFTHQFQTAERILAPDWAENHYLPLGLRGCEWCIFQENAPVCIIKPVVFVVVAV